MLNYAALARERYNRLFRLALAYVCVLLFTTICARAWSTEPTENEPRFPTCPEILAFAPALNAIRIHPRFSNFSWIRHRIEQVREYGQPYLTEKEIRDLELALDDVEFERGNTYHNRGLVAVLLNTAEDNLTREFATLVDRVVADLERNARIVQANGDLEHFEWLIELIARMDHYRDGISIERGAWYWQHARYEADRVLELESELPAWIAERRLSVVVTEPKATRGDFEFVIPQQSLGLARQRYLLRFALQKTYYRTPAPPQPAHAEMAHIPDLDSALSFLTTAPRLIEGRAHVALIGSTLIDNLVTPVVITLDAHYRFFTVRAVGLDPATAPYYQMVVGDGGRLDFLDAAPIDPDVAGRRPDLTHFAY